MVPHVKVVKKIEEMQISSKLFISAGSKTFGKAFNRQKHASLSNLHFPLACQKLISEGL